MNISDHKQTQLNNQLKELACTDFEYFCQIAGVDIVQALIILERRKGKSLQQISIATGISKQAVSEKCKKCQLLIDRK